MSVTGLLDVATAADDRNLTALTFQDLVESLPSAATTTVPGCPAYLVAPGAAAGAVRANASRPQLRAVQMCVAAVGTLMLLGLSATVVMAALVWVVGGPALWTLILGLAATTATSHATWKAFRADISWSRAGIRARRNLPAGALLDTRSAALTDPDRRLIAAMMGLSRRVHGTDLPPALARTLRDDAWVVAQLCLAGRRQEAATLIERAHAQFTRVGVGQVELAA